MPLYIYQNPKTGEQIEVLQGMNDDHVYHGKDGTMWERVFTIPQASVDANIDPFSRNNFVEKTGKTKGKYGDLQDRAKELSEKRKDKIGFDPVAQKYFDDYSSERRGIKHQLDERPVKPEKLKDHVAKKRKQKN